MKSAKRAAQEPVLDVQPVRAFVARAQKRLAAHNEERVRLVSELQEGESRFARLREAAAVARDVPVPQPVQPDAARMVKVLQDEGRTLGFTSVRTLSSKNTFIQKHFHPKTLSSKNTSSQNTSSQNTFVQKHFCPKPFHPKLKTISSTTLSSKTGFIQ